MKVVKAIGQRGAMKFIVSVMFLGITATSHAQSDPEYMMEVGA